MSSAPFTVWDAQTFTAPAGIVAGEPIDLAISAPISNSPELPAVRLNVNYATPTPDQPAGGNWRISALLEAEEPVSGDWFRVAHQFAEFFRAETAPEQEITLDPATTNLDVGLAEVVFIAGKEVGQISRTQGKLPSGKFRVRVRLVDYNAGGANAFQSVTISSFGERHD